MLCQLSLLPDASASLPGSQVGACWRAALYWVARPAVKAQLMHPPLSLCAPQSPRSARAHRSARAAQGQGCGGGRNQPELGKHHLPPTQPPTAWRQLCHPRSVPAFAGKSWGLRCAHRGHPPVGRQGMGQGERGFAAPEEGAAPLQDPRSRSRTEPGLGGWRQEGGGCLTPSPALGHRRGWCCHPPSKRKPLGKPLSHSVLIPAESRRDANTRLGPAAGWNQHQGAQRPPWAALLMARVSSIMHAPMRWDPWEGTATPPHEHPSSSQHEPGWEEAGVQEVRAPPMLLPIPSQVPGTPSAGTGPRGPPPATRRQRMTRER